MIETIGSDQNCLIGFVKFSFYHFWEKIETTAKTISCSFCLFIVVAKYFWLTHLDLWRRWFPPNFNFICAGGPPEVEQFSQAWINLVFEVKKEICFDQNSWVFFRYLHFVMIFMNACAGPAVPHTSKGQRVSKASKMFSAKLPPSSERLRSCYIYHFQPNSSVGFSWMLVLEPLSVWN